MVFDLDGVITFTARVHAAAWKELFDSYLQSRAKRLGEVFVPFDLNYDYLQYVDGKPRYDGVSSFLASRGIHIPFGGAADPPQAETITALGNQKDELFKKKVDELGVEYDHEAVRFVADLRDHGVRVGIASSSKNAVPILARCGIIDLFQAIVDGNVSEQRNLRGKPAPDIFLACLSQLLPSATPDRSGIAEDAIAGVEAGRNGRFGLVLGVNRTGAPLEQHGANWVIHDFRGITADKVSAFFDERAQVA
jgi:beta-phosphoglucomutase-like phosphatase (HAD superfamily)